jgi:hypothetical protein
VADEVVPPASSGSQSPVPPPEPAKPTEPVAEAEPPIEPEPPVEPESPVEPVTPTEPIAPAEPVLPAEPVVPAEPVAPEPPVEPEPMLAETAEPATETAETVEPAVEAPAVETPAADVLATPGKPPGRSRAVLAGWGLLALVVVALAVTGIAIAFGHHGSDQSLRAKQGDCLSGESDTDLKRVSCGDAAVKWTVVGVVQDKTQNEAKQQACSPWPQSEASYWESRNGKTGFVLCLAGVPGK